MPMSETDPPMYRTGPAFTIQQHTVIEVWAEQMRPRGLRVEVNWQHQYLEEALHVIPRFHQQPRWLVFPAVDGGVGISLCPGLAKIVPTLDDALAAIATQLDEADR